MSDQPSTTNNGVKHHMLSVLVENKAGVLTRVAALFARRGFNIHSLAVAPTDDTSRSRISMVVDVESSPLEQMIKQLDKLINVIDIEELAIDAAVQRELLLMTIHAADDRRDDVLAIVEKHGGRVLNETSIGLLISVDGEPEQLDDVEAQLRRFDVAATQRTGRIALPRLAGQ